MQWNCPHCGISLAIKDSVIALGWSFSKCSKCGGVALVRKSEINVIKVDKAPPGENIILPEIASNSTTPLLSNEATKRMARFIPPASGRDQKGNTTLNSGNSLHANSSIAQKLNQANHQNNLLQTNGLKNLASNVKSNLASSQKLNSNINLPQNFSTNSSANSFPDPLPEPSFSSQIKNGKSFKIIPLSISLAVLLALTSGVFLFIQAQALVSDRIQKSAMAPVKDIEKNFSSGMQVKVKQKNENLYSGPGLDFPIMGQAMEDEHFMVEEWQDQWFKLKSFSEKKSHQAFWIKNDLVEILTHTP